MNHIERERRVLGYINRLPKKILQIHGYENIPEFILHELCHKECFNFIKAAYLVDNPDFNYCKGIAGFSRDECLVNQDIWQDPEKFIQHMKRCSFHQKVRLFEAHSSAQSLEQLAAKVIKDFSFQSPKYIVWDMKHDNHGMLIYEREEKDELTQLEDYLQNSVYLFGFCPIY